ncbi:hypothetical protein AB0C29_05000 [Actinoplanes sp. NPDC048791]|uniref:hypothetical protein n=1 Tax=Actinoplanes sp. NPDC048791 TaxID=3154623 RepID=UPI0033C2D256
MNCEPLVNAIAAAMMFLEESGDDEVDPDSAVRALENMSHALLQYAGPDREDFLELIERVADGTADEHDARFIRDIPRMIGMVES